MSRYVSRSLCGWMLGLALLLSPLTVGATDTLTETNADAPRLITEAVEQGAAQNLQGEIVLSGDGIGVEFQGAEPQATEVVQERYPNRAVKIERTVAQDGEGNYFNHGPWTMWDENGRMLGSGQYRHGLRHGKWTRWFAAGESELFDGPVYKHFQPPFVSQATFSDGQLDGAWIVVDSKKRQVSAWEFSNGVRHGKSLWWYPNGQKWREVTYMNGVLEGELTEWTPDLKLVKQETYTNGYRKGTKVEWYSPGVKKFEAEYLFAKDVIEASDDWWKGSTKVKVVGKAGEDQRHGRWRSWDKNAQLILDGQYVNDVPVGRFTWWHSNGQKAIEGHYVDGKQDGKWTWWHENGLKQIEGRYDIGQQDDQWVWWSADGMVASRAMFASAAVDKADAIVSAPADVSMPADVSTPADNVAPVDDAIVGAPVDAITPVADAIVNTPVDDTPVVDEDVKPAPSDQTPVMTATAPQPTQPRQAYQMKRPPLRPATPRLR